MLYSDSLSRLIDMFKKMPGIGHKSAIRLAFNIVSMSKEEADEIISTIKNAKEKITYCSICQNLTETDPCDICSNDKRDHSTICVMETPKDVIALEKTREYFGLYHVLHGSISPMDNVTPDMLKIKELIVRLKDERIKEVILATNPSIEGEATAMYLARLIKPLGIKVTRIASGIPVGGDLEYADDVTITKAIELRHEM
ncbi:MAG: recombination mediator RecR [Oscillospiraceae bacterium]|nr:recombination mediator RecR [Oscillospiraceae bacterium]